jgi:hypothetical protein
VKAIADALVGYEPEPIPDDDAIEAALGPIDTPVPGAD